MALPRTRTAALCLLALQLAAQLLAAQAQVRSWPPMPRWAKGPSWTGAGKWPFYSVDQGKKNRGIMAAANRAGTTYDFLLFGDSITQLIFRKGKAAWAAAFPPAKGWASAPYGVSGNDVQDLMWRLGAPEGWERPARAPRVVALLIGTNNVNARMPVAELESKMDEMLRWWAAAHPRTKVVLLALLPSSGYSVAAANRRYRQLAARRRVTYKDCGGVINAKDPAILYDGTHPTPAAMELLLRCLAPTIGGLVGKPVYT